MAGKRLIFQLGTNNWQRNGEFAPGSGILHEAHHNAFNLLPETESYSIYPSKTQRFEEERVRVFALDHDIPICESISPVSSYRWHGMSEPEVAAYRDRLTREVGDWMAEIEHRTGEEFQLAIAHHTFLNPLVMRDVIRARVQAGRNPIPLICFAHGTALKMYAAEKRRDNPDEFPYRFLPMIQDEGVFDFGNPKGSVDMVAAISTDQVDAFLDVFPQYPKERLHLSPNGFNHAVFYPRTEPTRSIAERLKPIADYETKPYEGSRQAPRKIGADYDHIVAFCGKFADWKRLDVLLKAAAIYEPLLPNVATVIVGSGPHEDQVKMQDLALEDLSLENTLFLGPRGQDELAHIFSAADIGCFPSKNEPFGLVFIECMACGTPVIGANSGGPKDFVTDSVGALFEESVDKDALALRLAELILAAVRQDWKTQKGPTAARYAKDGFSVNAQCERLLEAIDALPGA
ncbi:MAG: glycosyltransferase family 4 protein [Pseudomonadota bacterium]